MKYKIVLIFILILLVGSVSAVELPHGLLEMNRNPVAFTYSCASDQLLGDVSGNGEVSSYDASLALQYIEGFVNFDNIRCADVNCDNQITEEDANLILQYKVRLINRFPCKETNQINLIKDRNGNIIQDNNYNYEYDEFNQLIKVIDISGNIFEEYVYDDTGNRIKKIEYLNGNLKITYYPDKNFVREIDNSGVKDTIFYYDKNVLLGKENSTGVYFYHPDHLGSTTLVTNLVGNVIKETSYLPFGTVFEGGNDRYLFTGKELDKTGLMYYGARYYNPLLRNFIQPDSIIQDPYNPQNLNRYSYVLNNPYKYTDTTGNYIETAIDIASLGWSIRDIIQDPGNVWNWVALGADIITTALPVVAGGGLLVKAAVKGEKIVEAVDKATDVGKVNTIIKESKRTVSNSQKIKEINKFIVKFPDGRIREYGKLRPAKKLGPTIGQRYVKEIDPITGDTRRVWMENYNNKGEVIQVHPKYPEDIGHLKIDQKTSKVKKNGISKTSKRIEE